MSLDQAANTEAHLEHPAARLLSFYWRRFHPIAASSRTRPYATPSVRGTGLEHPHLAFAKRISQVWFFSRRSRPWADNARIPLAVDEKSRKRGLVSCLTSGLWCNFVVALVIWLALSWANGNRPWKNHDLVELSSRQEVTYETWATRRRRHVAADKGNARSERHARQAGKIAAC